MLVEIFGAIGILVGLGLFFASILAIANKTMRVVEDPRIDQVEELLPGSNCGACGEPGCRAFSEKLVRMDVTPGKCTVSSPENAQKIATMLGVDVGLEEKRVARLSCAGGKTEAIDKTRYKGKLTCGHIAIVSAGNKGCSWGCLGLGDCEVVCQFKAITMNSNNIPVVDFDACTACGDCVDTCPKQLYTIMPINHKLLVQCRSRLEGEIAEIYCSVACNACGRCAADAEPGTIIMKNNLPVIDYSAPSLLTPAAAKRCPTAAIQWVDGPQFSHNQQKPHLIQKIEVF